MGLFYPSSEGFLMIRIQNVRGKAIVYVKFPILVGAIYDGIILHSHIENIVLSATKILGIMRKLKYSISRNALNQMYMSFLLPVVEYASVVWNGCSEQDLQTLQKIKNEATRLVTGLTRSVSLENLFKECGWTTLSKRRQQHKLSFMYKVNNDIVPSYIQDLIPPIVSEISNYPLRNNRNISVPFNRTSISQKSCIPSSIRLWNSLEDDLKNLSTLQTFKKHITSSFNNSCVPSHFTIGNITFLNCMHDFEIIAAALIMTFLEIISVIILYVIYMA